MSNSTFALIFAICALVLSLASLLFAIYAEVVKRRRDKQDALNEKMWKSRITN